MTTSLPNIIITQRMHLGIVLLKYLFNLEKGLRKINYVLSCTQVTPHHLVLKQSLVALLQLCPRKPRSVMATLSFAFQNKKDVDTTKCSATMKKGFVEGNLNSLLSARWKNLNRK